MHVRSGDPTTGERQLTTHCMMIFVALDDERQSAAVREWVPVSDEDVALDAHARQLVELRKHTDLLDHELPRTALTGPGPLTGLAVPATRGARGRGRGAQWVA